MPIPREEILTGHYKPDQRPMAEEAIGPSGEAIVLLFAYLFLLNGHDVAAIFSSK